MNSKYLLIILFFIISIGDVKAVNQNIGNWTFNQGSGNYANDSSGLNHNGTLSIPNPVWSTNLVNGSVNGTSLSFYGANNNTVNVSHATTLNATTMTIGVWVKLENTTASPRYIVSKWDPGSHYRWGMYVQNSLLYFSVGNGVSTTTVTAPISTNRWDYYVGRFDGAQVILFKNDVAVSNDGLAGILGNNSALLQIGGYDQTAGSTSYFNGTLDEIKYYNYFLSQAERTADYQMFQPVPAYPVGGITLTATTAANTIPVNFSWHDSYPYQDEVSIYDDAGLTNLITSSLSSTDYANITLDAGKTYYWRVRQYDSATGTYKNTSATQTFNAQIYPGYLNVVVKDERNLTYVSHYTATIYNTTYSYSKSTTSGVINFTSSEIAAGEYLLTITPNSTYAARSILVTSPYNATVYIPSHGFTVDEISFYLLDYTSNFNFPSTVFSIYRNSSTMYSSYFDVDAKVTANLIDGDSYFITVQNGDNLYNWGNYVPAGTGSIQITITNIGVNKSELLPFTFNTSYTNTSINLAWTGNSGELTQLNFTILNSTSQVLVHQLITSVPSGESTFLVTNTSEVYYVFVTANTQHGYMNSSFAIDYSHGVVTGAVGKAMIPSQAFTWGSYTLDAATKNNAAILILILLAGSFGAMFAALGGIIVSLFSLLFAYWGWLSYTGAGIGFFGGLLFYSILYFMQDKGRKT